MSESLRAHELELDRVLQLAQAYQEPRILLTACELDLFLILCGNPISVEQIAEPRGWDARALRVLLDALTVMGFVEKTLDKYSIAHANRALLSTQDSRGAIALMRLSAKAWPAWSQLSARITRDVQLPPVDTSEALVDYTRANDEKLAPGIAALIRPEKGRSFLDVGDSAATYASAFLARDRSLRATLLIEPHLAQFTQRCLERADFATCVNLAAKEPQRDEWPAENDLVFLSALIHKYSGECCKTIYRKAFQALNAGGRLVVRDHVMNENRLRPRAGSLLNVQLLVSTLDGQTYTFSEIRRGMEQAGFVDVRLVQDGERMNGLVEAFKPDHSLAHLP